MSTTRGQELFTSQELQKKINEAVATVEKASNQIRTIKEPTSEAQTSYAALIERVNGFRGRPLFYNYIGSGLGRGPYVELADGSIKLDLINGIGIHVMGHSHPRVLAASVKGALSDIVMQGHLEPNEEYEKLSAKLLSLAGKNSRLKHCWISTCGTIANENALKIVRQKHSPARMIVTFKNAFAGRSTMMAEITDNPTFKEGLPEYNEVLRLPFCNRFDNAMCGTGCGKDKTLNALKEHVAKHKGNISCFVFEPMLGEGGYRVACREFFLPLLQFCKEQKIAIWADEVQTFTRTGNFFAYETFGFGDYVDVVTVAKTVQAGATLYTSEYNPKPGLIAGTFAGSSAALSAGHEILNILDEEGYMGPEGKVQKIHKEFVSMLNRLNETSCKGMLREAGGLGLMIAVTPLDGSKDKQQALLKSLFANGLIAFGCGSNPYRVRFLIPAVMQSEDIQLAGKIIEKSILVLA